MDEEEKVRGLLLLHTYTMATAYTSSRQLRKALPLVDRFLFREARLQQKGTEIASTSIAASANPYPFQPYKHPVTGRWIAPRLSLRRQAQLGKTAFRDGQLERVVQSVSSGGGESTGSTKIDKMVQRIKELNLQQNQDPFQLQQEKNQRLVESEREAPKLLVQDEKQVMNLAKSWAASSRPYSGRSHRNIFKGTKAEREAPARKRRVAEKLEAMDKTIAAWKKVS